MASATQVSLDSIRQLRARLPATSLAEAKAALVAANGNVEVAVCLFTASPEKPPPPPKEPEPLRETTMDRQTHAILLDSVPDLTLVFERVVPSSCFLVRVQDEWSVSGKNQYFRKLTADLSGEEGGLEVDQLLDATVAGLSAAGLARLPDDPERRRAAFVHGDACVRAWPARALLVDCMLDVLRLDLQKPGTKRGVVEVAGDLLHYLDALQPIDITAVLRETFIKVGSDLPGGGRLSATFVATPDLGDKLGSCAYRLDAKTGRYQRGGFSVQVSGSVATWEATW
jgi:hypothetical protein